MKMTFRWYGESDPVTLENIRQIPGMYGIVSAIYDVPVGEVWPVAFNPYIELAAAHPITTNCMNCHHRAAWPPRVELDKPDQGRVSLYLQSSPANPNALEVFDSSNDVFRGLLMLDSMWAISDRAGFPASR